MCNLLRFIRATFWVLLQAMFMSDWKQTAQRLKLQKRQLAINKRKIIRWNIYRDNNFHLRRQVLKCLWKSLFMFLAGLPVFALFKDELEARKLLKAFFYSQNSLKRFLSVWGEKMSKGFLKFYKLIIKPDTRSSQILQTCIN